MKSFASIVRSEPRCQSRTEGPHCHLSIGRWLRFPVLAWLMLASAAAADPQALRVQQRTLRPRPELLCVLCSLTVTASPASITFALVKGGVAAGSGAIVITTTMTGVSALSSLTLYGYFGSSSAALTDFGTPANNIPSSAVLGQMPTGIPTSFTAFTQSNVIGTAGAGLELYSTTSLLTVGCLPSLASCRTDSLNLEINLASLPQLPAGSYTGYLMLEAQAL